MGVGDPAPDLGGDGRVGHGLEVTQLSNIGEHDLCQRSSVDSPGDDCLRPAAGNGIESLPALEHLVSDNVCFYHRDAEFPQSGQHGGLPGAHAAGDDDSEGSPFGTRPSHRATVPCASMNPTQQPWERRLDWLLSVLMWTAFGVGLFLSIVRDGRNGTTMAAGIAIGAYVVTMQVTPRNIRHADGVGELLSVGGVLVALFAVAITDGISSPYLLLLVTPSFFAGAFLGYRIGLETALLTGAGLVGVVALLDQAIVQGQVVQVVLLYVLIAATFAQTRRVLVEERAAAAEIAGIRRERLEAAHAALASLEKLADAADLNPVTVGRAALRDLALLVPYAGGQVVLSDEDGPIVVARRGMQGLPESRIQCSMDVGRRHLGHVALWPEEGENLARSEAVIEEVLRPATLAYDNIALLRSIARRAVREERMRLARELHDDIGPSLASLGLGIDTVLMGEATDDALALHLETMRRSVTDLVEEIRHTAADLRHEPATSLVEHAHRVAGQVGADGPAVLINIDERRPPRSAIATDLAAIMTEAVRNAALHASARSIRIEGYVERDEGTLSIIDDGMGFDIASAQRKHFGLKGMRERAEVVGAALDISSERGKGSNVTLKWGPT